MKILLGVFLLFSLSARADFNLYQALASPVRIQDDLQLSTSALDGESLNKGTAAQEVLRFLETNRTHFGLKKVNGEVLELRRLHKNETGFSLRFIQRHNRVNIEGAEIIAMFNWDGHLEVLNSSLVPTPKISVQPDLDRRSALRLAVNEVGLSDPELGEGIKDGLLITTKSGSPVLVWQFSLREYETGEKPTQVQVVASGPDAGEIFSMLSLAHTATKATLNIYDASVVVVTPSPIYKGVKVLKNGKPTLAGRVLVSDEATDTSANLTRVMKFYDERFNRSSFDGRDATVNASVNVQRYKILDFLGLQQNAAWMGPWKMFVFGAGGDELGNFGNALDVVGHEFTHAVIESTSNLAYENQSGALNEHLADFFGAVIESHYEGPEKSFLLGEKVLRGEFAKKAEALRDMLNPEKSLSPQPTTVDEIFEEYKNCTASASNDNCGVHSLSGIPNRATALAAVELGWDAISPLIYRVMTARLRSTSDFNDYKSQVMEECRNSLTQDKCTAIETGFNTVGL